MAGNQHIDYSGYEDTGENYYICIRGYAEEGYTIIIYTTEPAGTYTVSITSDNCYLIVYIERENGTRLFLRALTASSPDRSCCRAPLSAPSP